MLTKFPKVFKYSTFIRDSVSFENVEIIRITGAKVESGLRFKKIGWLTTYLVSGNLLFS